METLSQKQSKKVDPSVDIYVIVMLSSWIAAFRWRHTDVKLPHISDWSTVCITALCAGTHPHPHPNAKKAECGKCVHVKTSSYISTNMFWNFSSYPSPLFSLLPNYPLVDNVKIPDCEFQPDRKVLCDIKDDWPFYTNIYKYMYITYSNKKRVNGGVGVGGWGLGGGGWGWGWGVVPEY